jgi:glutamate formiminotransferase/formiminotetrahydrofolate cyclodeaminase
VGALCAHAALHGAWMNVRINATSLKDEKVKNELLGKAEAIGRKADEHLAKIKAKTDQRLG